MTQTSRDISGRRIFISNEGQTMPQNTNNWNHFLDNGQNKTELIFSSFKVKLLFTEFTNTFEITPSGINVFYLQSSPS